MAATDSIQYRIAENIVTTLKLIKTTGGYKYTIPDANCLISAAMPEWPTKGSPAALVDILDSQPVEDQGHTIVESYRYMISFFNVHSGGENPAINDDNKNAVADIVKALKVDVSRGGLAHYTEKGQSGPAVDMDTGAPYTFVEVLCLSTVNSANPYSI